jgi:hypothetical protein
MVIIVFHISYADIGNIEHGPYFFRHRKTYAVLQTTGLEGS